jgi:hypothetical protein
VSLAVGMVDYCAKYIKIALMAQDGRDLSFFDDFRTL